MATKFSADFLPQKGVADTCKGLKGKKKTGGAGTRNTEPGKFIIENWREKNVFQTSTK